jgi:hypothetical protein
MIKRGLITAMLSLLVMTSATAHAQTAPNTGVAALLRRFEQVVQAGDLEGYLGLLTDSADRNRARDFGGTELMPGATRAVIQERDRQPLPGTLPDNGYSLLVDAFVEYGQRARIATWTVDIKRVGDAGSDREWAIADLTPVSSVESLYRDVGRHREAVAAQNLKIAVEDLDLTLIDGSVFLVNVDQGVTGMVLLGHGAMRFRPTPETEQGQVKIFCGSETLESVRRALHPPPPQRLRIARRHTEPAAERSIRAS